MGTRIAASGMSAVTTTSPPTEVHRSRPAGSPLMVQRRRARPGGEKSMVALVVTSLVMVTGRM